ncbi:hypothetical protein BRADI_4g13224v3 [Brachypodium distachyon]|uniref:Uncharacterized protein n=1 Tax=Brachypodium distachyon TaxID=15368 RepID=A0A2K2CMG7_BRADI|nr:hypothetical protein BRADI_4g13224v3 [Brachypodium distachyon]
MLDGEVVWAQRTGRYCSFERGGICGDGREKAPASLPRGDTGGTLATRPSRPNPLLLPRRRRWAPPGEARVASAVAGPSWLRTLGISRGGDVEWRRHGERRAGGVAWQRRGGAARSAAASSSLSSAVRGGWPAPAWGSGPLGCCFFLSLQPLPFHLLLLPRRPLTSPLSRARRQVSGDEGQTRGGPIPAAEI